MFLIYLVIARSPVPSQLLHSWSIEIAAWCVHLFHRNCSLEILPLHLTTARAPGTSLVSYEQYRKIPFLKLHDMSLSEIHAILLPVVHSSCSTKEMISSRSLQVSCMVSLRNVLAVYLEEFNAEAWFNSFVQLFMRLKNSFEEFYMELLWGWGVRIDRVFSLSPDLSLLTLF